MAHKLLGLGIILSLLVVSTTVWAESADPKVVSGTASFQQSGANWTITTSDQAVITWQRFDVPAGSTMQFIQPAASSLVVNRVIGPAGSYINGLLTANGRLYLINPHGITVGPTGVVRVNEFIASTLNASNAELLSGGQINFMGISPAAIENFGRIEAIGGDIYLVAARVSNHGTVSAPGGKVGMAAGNDVLLTHDKELFVRPTGLAGVGGTGIDNSGVVEAVSVELKAHGNMYDLAVNTSGVVRATGFEFQDGRVVLNADGGTVVNSGVLAAKTVDAEGKTTGGEVQVLGRQVALLDGSVIDVSGDLGGGQVNVGGSYQGNGPLPNAEKTVMLSGARITADALEFGDGGQVIVWSDYYTLFDGQISARGGELGGNGGLVETSCKDLLIVSAGQVDAGAPSGQGGNWLLDPYNVEISNAPERFLLEAPLWTFTSTSDKARIKPDTIEGALNVGTSVTVQTGAGGAGAKGHITFGAGAAITMDADGFEATLRLQAHKKITISQPITSDAGVLNVVLDAGDTVKVDAEIITNGGDVTVNSGGMLTLNDNVTAGGGRVTLNPTDGGVNQKGGSLTAGELLLTGVGDFDLDQGGNNVGTLAVNITGELTYTDTDGLTVGSLAGTDGISTGLGANDVTLKTGGELTLLQDVTAAAALVTLNPADGGGVEQTGGILTADELLLLGKGTFNLNQANDVDTLAADITGALTFTDTNALIVDRVVGTSGISTGGNLTLNTGDWLTLEQDVTATAALVTLNATAGGVEQTFGELAAASLLLKGVGNFTIAEKRNDFATVAANVNGSVTLQVIENLAVGTLDGVTGIQTSGGAVDISAPKGRIAVNQPINTRPPLAGGTLTIIGDVTLAGGVLLGEGNVTLEGQPVPPLPPDFFGALDQSGDYDSRRGQWVQDHLDEMTYQELLALRREVAELAGGDVRWADLLTSINTYMAAVVSRMENATFYKP